MLGDYSFPPAMEKYLDEHPWAQVALVLLCVGMCVFIIAGIRAQL